MMVSLVERNISDFHPSPNKRDFSNSGDVPHLTGTPMEEEWKWNIEGSANK